MKKTLILTAIKQLGCSFSFALFLYAAASAFQGPGGEPVPPGTGSGNITPPIQRLRTLEGTVVEEIGSGGRRAIVLESNGNRYYVQTQFIPREHRRNPTAIGDIYSAGARVKITYRSTSRINYGGSIMVLDATRIVGLGNHQPPPNISNLPVATTVLPPTTPTRGTTSTPAVGPGLSIDLGNNVKLDFARIPAGTFLMGSPSDEVGRSNNEIQHQVTISHDFYIGRYEVTQAQWQAVMGKTVAQQQDNSYFRNPLAGVGGNYPMYYVDWDEAQEFVGRLNALNNGFTYRLPTEAEWEYVARAGTGGAFAGRLDAMAWYANNSGIGILDADHNSRDDYNQRLLNNGNSTHPVGMKQPNDWGVYDMHGNVSEWCQDWYGDYDRVPAVDPIGPPSGKYRAARGGSWYFGAESARSAARSPWLAFRNNITGFRVVAVARAVTIAPDVDPNPPNSTDTNGNAAGVKQLFRFSSSGCVQVEIHAGPVRFHPKGGEVIITPPAPASAWRDRPGIATPIPKLPTGSYKICAADPYAWGVEIEN